MVLAIGPLPGPSPLRLALELEPVSRNSLGDLTRRNSKIFSNGPFARKALPASATSRHTQTPLPETKARLRPRQRCRRRAGAKSNVAWCPCLSPVPGTCIIKRLDNHPAQLRGHGGGRWPTAITRDRTPKFGYERTREAAMAAFAKSWRRE